MANYRRVFLDGYSYFLTVTTYKRNPILIENIGLLRKSFAFAKSKFDFNIEEIVILPDHFHIIITVERAADYPKIISTIKRYFSKHCDSKYTKDITQSSSRIKKRYSPVWQKRYFEHTIRDEKDYAQKIEYMKYNPVKHGLIDNADDWKYSSFYKKSR